MGITSFYLNELGYLCLASPRVEPGNWDPFEGTQRLPRVDFFGSGRDNFIGIRALVFN